MTKFYNYFDHVKNGLEKAVYENFNLKQRQHMTISTLYSFADKIDVCGIEQESHTCSALRTQKNLLGNWSLVDAAVDSTATHFTDPVPSPEALDCLCRLGDAIDKIYKEIHSETVDKLPF